MLRTLTRYALANVANAGANAGTLLRTLLTVLAANAAANVANYNANIGAKAAVKAIMKKSISGGRGVSVDQAGEHGASDIDIHGMVSSAAECIFKDACTGAS